MIDLDGLDEQLTSAVRVTTGPRRRVPEPVPRAGPASAADELCRLLELGLLDQADARAAATADGCDATTWTTMRALLAGDRDRVGSGVAQMLDRARAGDDPGTWRRYWIQRFWAAVEWGAEAERYEVLDHCRERAYRFDDPDWWGNLTLLLAIMGKDDEALRAFDAALGLVAGAAKDAVSVDVATNLLEGASLLGDSARAAAVPQRFLEPEGRLVVAGPLAVCKGSIDRYRGLALAAAGRWPQARTCFGAAASAHRALGAAPLLARTLAQAERVHAAA